MLPRPVPPEFELILECARFPHAPESSSRIHRLAAQPLDWVALLDMARHHQVVPLVEHSLRVSAADVPPEPNLTLRQGARANARRCFQAISELHQLTSLLEQQRIAVCVLKGLPLAIAAFHDPALREVGDIDLLVSPCDIERADRALQSLGYRRASEAAWQTPRRLRSYVAHQKEFEYDAPAGRCPIDLHWRLFRNRWNASNAGITEINADRVEVGTARIPVLPKDRLFVYLAVHGALDGWLRLKWLADIVALGGTFSPAEMNALLESARQHGGLQELSAAMLLAAAWLGAPPPPRGCLDLQDSIVSRLFRFSSDLLTSNGCRPIRESIPGSAWFKNEWELYPAARTRAELFRRSLFHPQLWARISLPDRLFWLYALLRPFDWAGSRLAGWLRPQLRRRLFHVGIRDMGLLIEAAGTLLFFRAALRFVRVERLVEWMGQGKKSETAVPEERSRESARAVAWAIGAIVRHSPLKFVCFPQALAAFFMLRRRGIPSRLFYGVARRGQQLKAHTWVQVQGRTIVGGEAASEFSVLAVFP